MRRFAALLALLMIFVCCFSFTSCGDAEKDAISDAVEDYLNRNIVTYSNFTLFYKSHTIYIQTIEAGKVYKVDGTVTAFEKGTLKDHTAFYSGEVKKFDINSEEYFVDIEIDKFT